MKTKTYAIPNISCKHCIHTITMELSEIAGVSEVAGDLDTKSITVTYEEPATDEELKNALIEINYPPA
jgi:copper chaperone